jgi:hypothetical protein
VERRLVERCRLGLNPVVRVVVRPSFQFQWALVRDLTASGMGLVLSGPLEPKDMVAIEFQSWSGKLSIIKTAQVRHVTQMPEGSWLVGCLFSTPLSAEEVTNLIEGEVVNHPVDAEFSLTADELLEMLLKPFRHRK